MTSGSLHFIVPLLKPFFPSTFTSEVRKVMKTHLPWHATSGAVRGPLSLLTPRSSLLVVFAIGALAACAPLRMEQAGPAMPSTSETQCRGTIDPPYGLAAVDDHALLNSALGPPGKGGLCDARVFRVTQPLTVYRVWDAGKAASQYGRWWSFNPPAGPVDAYRAKNAICPSWSRLDRVTQCHLKVGTEIVIGPGQSAQCDNHLTYPPSTETQVYVPNDTRDAGNPNLSVTECVADAAWP
jgi:hypothetical protein